MRTERGCRIGPLLLDRHRISRELDYRLLLARDLKLINPKDYGELAQQTKEVKRMLGGLLGKLIADS